MDYKDLNDYELVYQVRENDEVAYNLLIGKYSNLVGMLAKKILRKYKYLGIEYDDLYQEGMMGIIKALKDYNNDNTMFYTYASLCARREIERFIKSHTRKKRIVFADSISINSYVNNNPDLVLEDAIPSDYNLEKEYEYIDLYEQIINKRFDFDLTDSSILELKANGFSTKEISKLLELTYKTVNYRMQRMKKQLIKYS